MLLTITFLPMARLEILNGSNWSVWSSRMFALFRMNGLKTYITSATANTNNKDWDTNQEIIKGILEVYIQKDVWAAVADDTKFKTVKAKLDELKHIYGGVGAMSTFNSWAALTGTVLNDATPMLPQLQKLNDARTNLDNNNMKITDLQFCFILIKALPESYSAVASTILATGAPTSLDPLVVQECILNEESRRSGASASLNKVAPVRRNEDRNKVKCYYCQKPGHKSPDCRKKKCDEKDKKEKEKEKEKAGTSSASMSKSVNAHIQVVPTTATIEEISDNDEVCISLYAARSLRSRWMVDSGCTHHISPYRSDFTDYTSVTGMVDLGGRAQIAQVGSGTVSVRTTEGVLLTLSDVMHVPDAKLCYFSVTVLLEKKGRIVFENMGFTIYLAGTRLASGYCNGQLFWFDASISAVNAHAHVPLSIELWHQRMGHMFYPALMRYKDSVKGITLDSSIDPDQAPCPGCELRKQTRLPFPTSHKRSDCRLQIIYSDLASPMQEQSIQGIKYLVSFIDDHSRHGVVYFLRTKDQCAGAFKRFLAWAENQTSDKMLALHSDHGGEYLVRTVKATLDKKGIEHHLTMPGLPQQNGLAKRWNRTIMEKACAMLHSAGLSLGFWEFAVDTAVHIYNRTPSHTIDWQTPYEVWSAGHTPDVSYFCVFGCKAYVHVPEGKRKKLDPRSIEMTLVGYEPGSKGYQL
jgi:hypothetical protein